jgi:hypothetical protein
MKQPANVPLVLTFEGLEVNAKWTWETLGYRAPKKGEYYLSGAIPMAYRALNDLSSEYFVVRPVTKHKLRSVWVPCDEKVSAA